MKRALLCLLLFVLALSFTPDFSYAANGITGNVNLLMGQKFLSKGDWAPFDKQTEYGIDVDFGGTSWPVYIDAAYLSSSKNKGMSGYDTDLGDISADSKGSTTELRLGARYYVFGQTGNPNPYIGVGIASVKGKMEVSAYGMSETADDSAIGLYLKGGIFWTIAEHFNVGVEASYSSARIDIEDYGIQAGGLHALGFVGYHF